MTPNPTAPSVLTPETTPLSLWLRRTLGSKNGWKKATGDAAWLYDKMEQAIGLAVQQEASCEADRRRLEATERAVAFYADLAPAPGGD
jgi:hypothetical protein